MAWQQEAHEHALPGSCSGAHPTAGAAGGRTSDAGLVLRGVGGLLVIDASGSVCGTRGGDMHTPTKIRHRAVSQKGPGTTHPWSGTAAGNPLARTSAPSTEEGESLAWDAARRARLAEGPWSSSVLVASPRRGPGTRGGGAAASGAWHMEERKDCHTRVATSAPGACCPGAPTAAIHCERAAWPTGAGPRGAWAAHAKATSAGAGRARGARHGWRIGGVHRDPGPNPAEMVSEARARGPRRSGAAAKARSPSGKRRDAERRDGGGSAVAGVHDRNERTQSPRIAPKKPHP